MRISDWSSDVCSSDLYQLLCTAADRHVLRPASEAFFPQDSVGNRPPQGQRTRRRSIMGFARSHRSKRPINDVGRRRSEEHTSELQSLMRISYAVFCLKKQNDQINVTNMTTSTSITYNYTQNHTSLKTQMTNK